MGHFAAKTVVVSISSAIPALNFAIILAVAGAISIKSTFLAREICSTSKVKPLSKASTIHLLPLSTSKVVGVIKLVAFFVIIT